MREMDDVLSSEETILPSSGFAESVMYAVRLEASVPAPIAFPWTRAIPGMVAACVALVLAAIETLRGLAAAPESSSRSAEALATSWNAIAQAAAASHAGWIGAALLFGVASIGFSLRLAAWRH